MSTAIAKPKIKKTRHKNQSLPSRIYRYGLRLTTKHREFLCREFLFAQLKLQNEFRNALVTVERDRRKAYWELMNTYDDVKCFTERMDAIGAQLKELRDSITQHNIKARNVGTETELSPQAKELVKERKTLRKERSAACKDLIAADEELTNKVKAVDLAADGKNKQCYANSTLYWATKIKTMCGISRSGPPPRYHKFDGCGELAVQFQKTKKHGTFHASQIFDANSHKKNIAFVEPLPPRAFTMSRKHRRTVLHICVGHDAEGKPVMAEFPMIMHRELPDAGLKWIYLNCKRVGRRYVWTASFVMSRAQGFLDKDNALTGAASLDLNWRKLPDGGCSVAHWLGDDGAEGEFVIPPEIVDRWKRADRFQQHQKKRFNIMRIRLATWLSKDVPPWLKEATKTLPYWQSPSRLLSLLRVWEQQRFKGDCKMVKKLQAWRTKNEHLYEMYCEVKLNARNWRNNFYRDNVIAMLRRRYRTLVVESTNWKKVQEHKQPETGTKKRCSTDHRFAAVGTLRLYAEEKMTEVCRVAAAWTSRKHYPCGTKVKGTEKQLFCPTCAEWFDRDGNACRNLLQAYINRESEDDERKPKRRSRAAAVAGV